MHFYIFQVEFVGGPMCWNSRIFSATAGEKHFFLVAISPRKKQK